MRPNTSNILEYVHWLESSVREYQTKDQRFHAKWFALGFLVGAAVMSAFAIAFLK